MGCFFFNDTATTEIYTLSLHDALPISAREDHVRVAQGDLLSRGDYGLQPRAAHPVEGHTRHLDRQRSEEHTSELQSRQYLVCRLLLEKKKNILSRPHHIYIAHSF